MLALALGIPAQPSVAVPANDPVPLAGQYYPVRVQAASGLVIQGNATAPLQVAGLGSLPATGLASVLLNLGARGTNSNSGALVVYAADASEPSTTSATYGPSHKGAAMTVTAVNGNGEIKIANKGAQAVKVDVNVHGYTLAEPGTQPGSTFVPLAPARILNGQNVPVNGTHQLSPLNQAGIPATGVDAVALSVTANGQADEPSGEVRLNGQIYCIDIPGGDTANGNQLQLHDCNATAAQNWTIKADGTIRALGKCVDVYAAGTTAGAAIQLYECNGTVAQQWVAEVSGGLVGQIRYKNPHSGLYIDLVDTAADSVKLVLGPGKVWKAPVMRSFPITSASDPLTCANGVTFPDDSTRGTVGNFNGTDQYCTVDTDPQTSGPVLDASRSFSVSAWVKLNSLPAAGNLTVLSQDGTQASSFYLGLDSITQKWVFKRPGSDAANPGGWSDALSDEAASTDWTHLTGTFNADNNQISLYVNGTLNDTATATTPWNQGDSIVIGRGKWAGQPADLFSGRISSVRTWTSAIVGDQAAAAPHGGGTGQLRVYPAGENAPVDPNMEFTPTAYTQNLAVSKMGTDGKVNIHNTGAAETKVWVDIAGYFTTTKTSGRSIFVPAAAKRIATNVNIPANGDYTLQPINQAGGSTSDLNAVSLNITAQSSENGVLQLHPSGTANPGLHTLAYYASKAVTAGTIAKLGTNGKVVLHNNGAEAVTVSVDLTTTLRPPGTDPVIPTPGDVPSCPVE